MNKSKTTATSANHADRLDQVDDGVNEESQIAWLHRSRKHLQSDGRDAYSQLQRAARDAAKGGQPAKMTPDEAAQLARRLYDYLKMVEPDLKRLGVSKTDLCTKAFGDKYTDSKELSRLTLASDADPVKRRVRVRADKYLALIQALAALLRRSVSQVAGEVLRGTKYHPLSRSHAEWTMIEKTQMALQALVDRLDAEFGWFETFARTAALKRQRIESGQTDCWPLYSVLESSKDALEKFPSPDARQAYLKEFMDAADPSQAYYRLYQHHGESRTTLGYESSEIIGHGTGQDWTDEFFYVPHAPIGYLLMNLPDLRSDSVRYQMAVAEGLADIRKARVDLSAPADEWREDTLSPRGCIFPCDYQRYHAWLIAYPHPAGGRVVPTIFYNLDEGEVYCLPLGIDSLSACADQVWYSTTEQSSVIERIQHLLLDKGEDGMSSMERSLRRTGHWLQHNPILKKHTEKSVREKKMAALLWADKSA